MDKLRPGFELNVAAASESFCIFCVQESAFCSIASTSQEGLEEETPTSGSNRTVNVTLLSSEWKSTKGGLSTISRELSIQLAKHPDVEVSVYLPQCSEEDKRIAASLNVKIIEAEELPGYEPVDWLGSVPDNHAMDCVIGHGVHLGRQIPLIKKQNCHCKWVQIVHTAPEDLGMYKTYEEAISKGEQKHQGEVKLCELADQVVAVGPKLADAFARYLRPQLVEETGYETQQTSKDDLFVQVLAWARDRDPAQQ